MRCALLLALTCACLVLAAAPASAAPHWALGMGDQHSRMFSDPRFAALGLRHARVVAPYDVACRPGLQQYYLDVWLAAAQRARVRPLVAFGPSARRGQYWKLPSYGTYLRCMRAFRVRYPWVRDFNPWNEANHSSQPTYIHPGRAAGYYNALRRVCRGCNVAAGDVLDWWNLAKWLRNYKRHLRGHPRLWSMHNYLDVNHRVPWRRSGTRAMLHLTRGRLWITESAGVVYARRDDNYDELTAIGDTRRMFDFASRSGRITRLYAYQWQAACDSELWDSAWFRSDGSSRPAYRVVVREVGRRRGLDRAQTAALDPPLGPSTYDTCTEQRERAAAGVR
jgi:polysaccharide biosynthesis protein PslG